MGTNRYASLTFLALAGLLSAACGGDDGGGSAAQTTTTAPPAVVAEMFASDGSPVGRVTFAEAAGRVVVEGRFTNLPPGFHGFHIHATGKCERPAFASAGGHMVSGDQAHPAHAGDQPPVLVLADRSAEIRFVTDRYTLADLGRAEGRAVIVHAGPDNLANIPTRYVREPDTTTKATGDAGDRIACGVVGGGPTPPAAPPAGATTTVGPAPSTTSARPGVTTTLRASATLDCKSVGFTPNSEDAASSVKATGLTCAEAEAFVRVAGRRTSSGGPNRVTVDGYRCVLVRTVQEPLPQAFYECTDDNRKVTFVRT